MTGAHFRNRSSIFGAGGEGCSFWLGFFVPVTYCSSLRFHVDQSLLLFGSGTARAAVPATSGSAAAQPRRPSFPLLCLRLFAKDQT